MVGKQSCGVILLQKVTHESNRMTPTVVISDESPESTDGQGFAEMSQIVVEIA